MRIFHRGVICAALSKRYPALAAIGTDADQILTQIDSRRAALQAAEDDPIRARAVENAEKFDVVEVYTELRRTLFAKKVDVQTLLPDAPSVLGRLAAKKFRARADQALENLGGGSSGGQWGSAPPRGGSRRGLRRSGLRSGPR
jgi:hypothetical protein